MFSRRLALGAFLVSSACLSGLHAQTATTQPATTRPATTRPAAQTSNDPHWIGPKSWERHFTIPSFVQTSRGLTMKSAATRPASGSGAPTSYFASRQRRTSTEGTAGASASSTPKVTKATRSESRRSSSSERSSSRRERKSRRD